MQSHAGLHHILQKSSSMGNCCLCRRTRECYCDHRPFVDEPLTSIPLTSIPLTSLPLNHPLVPSIVEAYAHHETSLFQCEIPNANLHYEIPDLHYEAPDLRYETPDLHYETPRLHDKTSCLHSETPPLHYETPRLHSKTPHPHYETPPLHYETPRLHSKIPPLHYEASFCGTYYSVINEQCSLASSDDEDPASHQHSSLMDDNDDYFNYHATTDHDHLETSANLQPLSNHSHGIADDESFSSAKPNHELQTLIKCNEKLTQSLLNCSLSITTALLARGLISDVTEEEVHSTNSIPHVKAAVLVSAIRSKVKVYPKRFHDFVSVLREHSWTKDIAEDLQSVYRGLLNNV